ncbi:tetratricopeptide repeat protein [Micromonosporaceae bacterium Da 78-11]
MSLPSPLTPAWQRAQALASSGDLAGARAVLERAFELGKVNLSEDDPDVLRTAYQLAAVHQRADDPSAARRVLEEAYAAGQWRLGDADPLMVEISHDIGVVAEELGNRHEARKAFARVVEFGPAALGADHWAVTRARTYLGKDQTPASVRPEDEPKRVPNRFSPSAAPQQPPPSRPAAVAPQQFRPSPQPNPAEPQSSWPAPQEEEPTWPSQEEQPTWAAQPSADGSQPLRPSAQFGPPSTEPSWPAQPASSGSGQPQFGTPADEEPPTTPYGPLGSREQATSVFPVVPQPPSVGAETTTNVFGAIPGFPAPGRGLVQPPSPENQRVWPGPSTNAPDPRQDDGANRPGGGTAASGLPAPDAPAPGGPRRNNPIDEPTVVQPIITPRTGPAPSQPGSYADGPRVPAPRRPVDAAPPQPQGYPDGAHPPQPHGLPRQPQGFPNGGHPPQGHGGYPTGAPSGGPGYFGAGAGDPYEAGRFGTGLPEPLVTTAPVSPAYRNGPERPTAEKRGMGLFAAIAAVLAAIIAVAALVFVLANRGDDRPSDPNVPTLGGKEPTEVRLRDEGSKIELTWQDPSAGTVSFIVAMGHPGELLKPVTTLGPGQTSYEMGALNTDLDYCFTVIAVYRGNQFATSAPACTSRPGAEPAPSTT